ncbi:MAG: response regulator transcription factor [Clostridia bacterium]|nr:response regulator transcription factor [Clostridia bacterium]
MNIHTIAVIEDDISIGNLLAELLTKEGYHVLRAYSGTEALMLLESKKPDLVLLDLMLPGLSGEDVLPKIKNTPVIVLSAKADEEHKADLLLDGAADYITKPFHTRELLARITVQLRRRSSDGLENTLTAGSLTVGNLTLDFTSHVVCVNDIPLHLTRTEFAILKLLMQNPGQVIAKSVLLDRISEDTPDCTESSLKVHISNLRQKLREADGKDRIEAVWGIGFRLAAE